MSQRVITLPYGNESIEVLAPENQLVGVYSPKDILPVADIKLEIRRALAHPKAWPKPTAISWM